MKHFENLKDERIVVTGGAGFVGSNIVHRLLKEGARVTVLDDFYTGSEQNLPADYPKLEIVRGSVTDFNLVREVVKGRRRGLSRSRAEHNCFDPQPSRRL